VINAGVSGDRIHKSRSRWHRDVLSFKPDLVTVSFGLNDSHDGLDGLDPYIQSHLDLVHRLRDETDSDILLLTPGMMMREDSGIIAEAHRKFVPKFLEVYRAGYLQKYVEALRDFAVDQGIPYVDVYAIWERLEADGVNVQSHLINGINHPDYRIHERMAREMEKRIFDSEWEVF
jgi:lysophospholipase L1-like esterase